MDLSSSDIKASLQPKTTKEGDYDTPPTNIDCCINQINQAIKTIENALFYDYEQNQNTPKDCAECDNNIDMTVEDKVKLLTARVESLEQELVIKEAELKTTQEELNYTNQDLFLALKPDILTQAEAKELAKNILASNDLIYESLAKLLSGIYNSNIQASELAPLTQFARRAINKCNNTQNSLDTQVDRLMSMHKALKEESTALRCESMNVRNRVAELKAKSKNIIARTASLKNQ